MSGPVFRRTRVVAPGDIDELGHVNNVRWVAFVGELAAAHAGQRGSDNETLREKGAIWTNRKYVFVRKGGGRFFMPVRNVAVPKGDDAPYPSGGTVSLLNSLRDAVRNGAAAETAAGDNVWSIAMLEAGKRSDAERREVAIDELLRPERLAA